MWHVLALAWCPDGQWHAKPVWKTSTVGTLGAAVAYADTMNRTAMLYHRYFVAHESELHLYGIRQ